MNLLTMEEISKSYGERYLFEKADFSINEGEKIGIIGVNGTGKSTLLEILAGRTESDSGRITMGNNLKISYLPQKPGIFQRADGSGGCAGRKCDIGKPLVYGGGGEGCVK